MVDGTRLDEDGFRAETEDSVTREEYIVDYLQSYMLIKIDDHEWTLSS